MAVFLCDLGTDVRKLYHPAPRQATKTIHSCPEKSATSGRGYQAEADRFFSVCLCAPEVFPGISVFGGVVHVAARGGRHITDMKIFFNPCLSAFIRVPFFIFEGGGANCRAAAPQRHKDLS
jgi:hypothetical protein